MFLWSCLFVSRETYSSGSRYDSRGRQQQDSGYSSRDSYRHGGRTDDMRHDSAANQRRDNSTHAQSQQPGRDFRDRDERYDRQTNRSVPDRLCLKPFWHQRYCGSFTLPETDSGFLSCIEIGSRDPSPSPCIVNMFCIVQCSRVLDSNLSLYSNPSPSM